MFYETAAAALRQRVEHFKFQDVPLSTHSAMLVVPLYLAAVFSIKRYVREHGAFDLSAVMPSYNMLICLGSALLWFCLGSELLISLERNSLFELYCDEAGTHSVAGPLVFYYYINYLFKYVELLDTMALCLRGKPTRFLHVYHHAATLVLCYTQLRSQSCMQWLPIIINLSVHVIMYYYYALAATGARVWWKRYLTQMQITQFVVVVAACLAALLPRWSHDHFGVQNVPMCHGDEAGGIFGFSVLFSYLVLFMRLYVNLYAEKKKGKAKQKQENDQKQEQAQAQQLQQRRTSIARDQSNNRFVHWAKSKNDAIESELFRRRTHLPSGAHTR